MIKAAQAVQTGKEPLWLQELRQAAKARFKDLGLPTVKREEWRYTNMQPLAKTTFVEPSGNAQVSEKDIPFYDWHAPHIVFVNGRHMPDMSALKELPAGVRVMNLFEAMQQDAPGVRAYWEQRGLFDQHAFAAWNTAEAKDGVYVRIAKGVLLQEPLHLLFVSAGEEKAHAAHLRNIIVLEPGAQATILESYAGVGKGMYLNNIITQIDAQEGAVLDHYKFQHETEHAYHVGVQEIRQGRNSNVSSQSLALGAALARNDIRVLLADEGCELTLDGLYMVSGRQHVDHHTVIDHMMPNCNSRELYLGVLDGKSHGVFDGKIYVRHGAQKSNARQTNRNLLLSDEALAHSKPQLEIYADDVKCNHGATIGQLDEAAIFYLRSRGIAPDAARALLTFAFANQILDKIKLKGLRAWLQGWVWNRLPGPEGLRSEA